MKLSRIVCAFAGLLSGFFAYSQNVTAVLKDATNDEAVSFATVSLTRSGQTKPNKYVLSDDSGAVKIDGVRNGTYTFKAELLGYVPFSQEIKVADGKSVDLGVLKMNPDREQLDAAKVSAAGNPIIIKKDTVEYNASSFKTTDNDMLEDLLKKLPGVEVASDGSVTANGQSISKITIDGKTFFLDDPSLASKNIPAKLVEKVKVVEKKSDQALFTGIDDGEEETIIDLSIRPGMMDGWFGNVMAGGGHDLQTSFRDGEGRWQGAAMVGNFSKKSQISVILNANNTNNRGFNDFAGSMMGEMRGGGGGMGRGGGGWGQGNGITTSWMGGLNGAFDLLDDRMELSGNYVYNGTNRNVLEKSNKITYLDGGDQLIYNNGGPGTFGSQDGFGYSNNVSGGHRIGIRLEHKFSENTSILFEPQVNFGTGSFNEYSDFTTDRYTASTGQTWLNNKGWENSIGANSNWRASGFLLLRQRLGKPGRTLSANIRYNMSGNKMDSFNQSATTEYLSDKSVRDVTNVNQQIKSNSKSQSVNARLSYTEPLAERLFLEVNYSYNWSNSNNVKDVYDMPVGSEFKPASQISEKILGTYSDTYSNAITNTYVTQNAGITLQYQTEKMRLQAGASFIPTKTVNATNGKDYESMVYNWSPQAMIDYEFNDNADLRAFYVGRSSQPSTSQLMPVPDNSNPLAVSFGNPYLTPYFNHNLRGNFGISNRQTFFSLRGNFGGGMTRNPITNAMWYGSNGAQYSMPLNGPTTFNANVGFFLNTPIAKSDFSISNNTRFNYSNSASYVGTSFNVDEYYNPATAEFDYVKFNRNYGTRDKLLTAFAENKTRNISVTERLALKYSNDAVEITASARTRFNQSSYTLSEGTSTWANQVRGEVNWTIGAGFSMSTDMSYNWYRGYTTPQEDEYVWNAEISKLLFKNKFTLSLKAYDILNQSKNLSISDSANYHMETRNNTLGRYIILSLTYRFGTFDMSAARRGPGGPGRGPGGPGRGPRM